MNSFMSWMQVEEATKKAAALELEIADLKRQNKSSLKKSEQGIKDLRRQLQVHRM